MDPNAPTFTAWHLTKKTLVQELRGTDPIRIDRAIALLPEVIAHCGDGSRHRRMILKIARALVPERPVLYAPCCPDYGHTNGRYTFRGMRGGVSLLAEQHIEFLIPIARLLPDAKIIFLLADQEADDEAIVRAVGEDHASFVTKLDASLAAMRRRFSTFDWTACFMTEAISTLREREIAITESIRDDAKKLDRLQNEMSSRYGMYDRIDPLMPRSERLRRTIRTAAQYVAMGEFVARSNALVCNHTTTNLSWYGETAAAILHNPVSVY